MLPILKLPTLIAMLSDGSRASLVLLGIAALVLGVKLMLFHRKQIDEIDQHCSDQRVRCYEKRKYRRRSLASTLIASMGILMASLYWAHEPAVSITLLYVILTLLTALMFVAFLDLMSVSLHTATEGNSSRQKMIDEYLRLRKKLGEGAEGTVENED